MRQQAVVESITGGGKAIIAVRRKSACSADCDSCKGCAHPEETVRAVALNSAGAKAGDTVTVETSSGRIIRLAGLVYIFPPVLMIAFYFLPVGPEGVKIACSAAGLVLGLLGCAAVSRKVGSRGGVTVEIVEVNTRPGDLQ